MTTTFRAIVAVMTLAGSLALAGGAFAQAAPKNAPKASQAQMQADKACQAHAKGSLQHQQCLRQHLAKSKKAAAKNKPPMTMKKTEQKA